MMSRHRIFGFSVWQKALTKLTKVSLRTPFVEFCRPNSRLRNLRNREDLTEIPHRPRSSMGLTTAGKAGLA